jgi:hypothetical protein
VFGLVIDKTHFDVPSFKKMLGDIENNEDTIGKTILLENLQAGKGKVIISEIQEKKNI